MLAESWGETLVRVILHIDRKHSLALATGQAVTLKVPKGATELTIQLSTVAVKRESSTAEIFDVFFNGRKAYA